MKRRRSPQENYAKANNTLKKYARVTPWIDQWELEAVGKALILQGEVDGNSMTVEQALDRVAVWRARSSLEQLPHSIESTAALAQVRWRDSSSCWSVTELRLAYSAAIVRCINGFADALQQQRSTAASVSILCGQLGIPSWLVDIRHEASHNALPTLSVLRLAVATLLDYLKNAYWIPTCSGWESSKVRTIDNLPSFDPQEIAVDLLVQYKTSAAENATSDANRMAGHEPQKMSSRKKQTNDIFEDTDSDEADDAEWGGGVWGFSIGTNANRFAALQSAAVKRPPPPSHKTSEVATTQSEEKCPTNYAREFVKHVPIQLGYSTALTFLVWGGVGGAPPGRGVLIPGSALAFPASEQGIIKARRRYSPLLCILASAWPGFAHTLLVHLFDFVITLEESVVKESTMDSGSARKLYFLSAWIRYLLSEQFIGDVTSSSEVSNNRSNETTEPSELPLASLSALQNVQYPLNSLCDRCCTDDDHRHSELRMTSRALAELFSEILGSSRSPSFRDKKNSPINPTNKPMSVKQIETQVDTNDLLRSDKDPKKASDSDNLQINQHGEGQGMLSLNEMEAMLSDTEEIDNAKVAQESEKRSAWVRCTSWDPCSIGTRPGYPV